MAAKGTGWDGDIGWNQAFLDPLDCHVAVLLAMTGAVRDHWVSYSSIVNTNQGPDVALCLLDFNTGKKRLA